MCMFCDLPLKSMFFLTSCMFGSRSRIHQIAIFSDRAIIHSLVEILDWVSRPTDEGEIQNTLQSQRSTWKWQTTAKNEHLASHFPPLRWVVLYSIWRKMRGALHWNLVNNKQKTMYVMYKTLKLIKAWQCPSMAWLNAGPLTNKAYKFKRSSTDG